MDRWEKFEMRVSVQEVFLDIATKRRESDEKGNSYLHFTVRNCR